MNTFTLEMKGLKDLRRKLNAARNSHVDVGIFASHNARDDGETNAAVGAKMEFGSTEESTPSEVQVNARGREYEITPTWSGNPARSFLEMPLTTELPSIVRGDAAHLASLFVTDGHKLVLEQIGFMGQAAVQEAFDTGGFGTWQPNSEKTKEWKGSDRPLIDSSQLRESISSRVVAGGVGDPF